MKFKLLNQYHKDYDHDKMDKLEALYKGGDYIMSHLPLFIPMLPGEHPQAYQARLACASYINYMAEIIDYYTSSLFSKPLAVLPASDAGDPDTLGEDIEAPEFYQQFGSDADLAGNSLSNVLQKVLTDALTYGCGYVGVDFPLIEQVPVNLAEEEMVGADRAYLYCVDPESLINYACDDFGSFKWCVLKKCIVPQDDPFSERDKKITQFKVWTLENGYAKWQLFEIETKINRDPKDNDEVPLVAEGITSFQQIPIICLEMEKGLWIGSKIGNLCADHFRMRTALIHSENRSLYAAPWYKQGEDSDSDGGDDIFRGAKASKQFAQKGFMVLGANDAVGFMEPEGKAYQLIDKQLKELSDEIHRTVHQMANTIVASTESLSRSAASKMMDNKATEIILSEYGDLVKEFAKRVYVCISEARNESIVWNPIGLTNYQIIDKDLLSKEALIVNNQLNIPSNTFKKVYLSHLADSFAPTISPETQLVIKKEIEDAVDSGQLEQPQVGPDGQPIANDPGQSNKLPGAKKVAQPKTDPSNSEDTPESIPVGASGHLQGYDGMHLQSGDHIDSQVVFDQLAEDYNENDIQWVLHIPWSGPMEVPLTSIDFSNKDNWAASGDTEHVDEFVDKISNEGFSKPIILVNSPSNNNKMIIVDGHHRAIAYQQIGQPAIAYVGHVGKDSGPWDRLHAKQVGKVEGSGPMQSKQV